MSLRLATVALFWRQTLLEIWMPFSHETSLGVKQTVTRPIHHQKSLSEWKIRCHQALANEWNSIARWCSQTSSTRSYSKSLAQRILSSKQVQLVRKRSHPCRCSQSLSKPLLERKLANRTQGSNQSNQQGLKDENLRRLLMIKKCHPSRQQATSIKTREFQRHPE